MEYRSQGHSVSRHRGCPCRKPRARNKQRDFRGTDTKNKNYEAVPERKPFGKAEKEWEKKRASIALKKMKRKADEDKKQAYFANTINELEHKRANPLPSPPLLPPPSPPITNPKTHDRESLLKYLKAAQDSYKFPLEFIVCVVLGMVVMYFNSERLLRKWQNVIEAKDNDGRMKGLIEDFQQEAKRAEVTPGVNNVSKSVMWTLGKTFGRMATFLVKAWVS